MAAKFIVSLAVFTLCSSNPVILKGYIVRDGRMYSIGQGYTNNANGKATGSAKINGGLIQAFGSASNDGQQLGRIGYGAAYPGETVAKAEIYDGPNTAAYEPLKTEQQDTPTFYAVPGPATIVSYEHNFQVPKDVNNEYPGTVAQSTAILNGDSETITSATANGPGVAQSSANTQGMGSYGITSSDAKTFGLGSATSNAKNSFGVINTATQSQGYGAASSKSQTELGLTSTNSQSNGGYASSSANNALDSVVVSANSQGYGSASSNIDSNNLQGVDVIDAKANDFRGWRFGTVYTAPTPGEVHASSQSYGGSAKSTAQTNGAGFGNAITTADTQGYGSAASNANLNGGYINSVANTNGLGYGAAKSTINNGYGAARTPINNVYGNVKSTANSNGYGNANAHADIDHNGSVVSVANSNGYGTASSRADSSPTFAELRSDGSQQYYSAPRAIVNSHTSGQGSASSSATQGNTGYRVVNSVANTSGYGTAQANASA